MQTDSESVRSCVCVCFFLTKVTAAVKTLMQQKQVRCHRRKHLRPLCRCDVVSQFNGEQLLCDVSRLHPLIVKSSSSRWSCPSDSDEQWSSLLWEPYCEWWSVQLLAWTGLTGYFTARNPTWKCFQAHVKNHFSRSEVKSEVLWWFYNINHCGFKGCDLCI